MPTWNHIFQNFMLRGGKRSTCRPQALRKSRAVQSRTMKSRQLEMQSFLIIFFMNRNYAVINFLDRVPNKIYALSVLNSKDDRLKSRQNKGTKKMQNENKNTAYHVERHIEKLILVSHNSPKCVKKATPTGPIQLAKSIHATSDNIA